MIKWVRTNFAVIPLIWIFIGFYLWENNIIPEDKKYWYPIIASLIFTAYFSLNPPRKSFQKFCLWLVMDSGIRLGRFAPVIFGWGIGRKGVRIK